MQNINETLDQAIRDKDITAVRRALGTWILQDPGFAKDVFDKKVHHCLSSGISKAELFVPFAGEPLTEESAAWTDRYFASAKTEFDHNFSEERLAHLRKVGAKLFPAVSKPSASSSNEEFKKKYSQRVPVIRKTGKRGGSLWLVGMAGIGLAALLWFLFRRK
jgi:hypothetical protein